MGVLCGVSKERVRISLTSVLSYKQMEKQRLTRKMFLQVHVRDERNGDAILIIEPLTSLCSGDRGTAVEGLLPKMKHKVTVIAVYRDRVEKEGSIEYSHTGRYHAM